MMTMMDRWLLGGNYIDFRLINGIFLADSMDIQAAHTCHFEESFWYLCLVDF